MSGRDIREPERSRAGQSLHFTRSSDGLVILDTARDAYLCLYDPDDPELEPDAASARDAARLRWLLVEQRIASDNLRSAGTAPIAWTVPAARHAPIAPRDVILFLVALGQAAFSFRRLGFSGLLDRARSLRQRRSARGEHADHATVALRFERLCLWLPFRMQCLFRSYFLLHLLRLHGLRADWIFGAALFPFEAHCWIVSGSTLLAERRDRVVRFSVMLRVAATAA